MSQDLSLSTPIQKPSEPTWQLAPSSSQSTTSSATIYDDDLDALLQGNNALTTDEAYTPRQSKKKVDGSASPAPTGGHTYDARALLNPKASAKRPLESQSQNGDQRDETEGAGVGSMIERMHNLERREHVAPARKKLKTDSPEEEDHKTASSHSFGGGSTELGRYIKDLRKDDSISTSNGVVDLTADDDEQEITHDAEEADGEDDVIFVSDSADKEVCMGRIEGAYINAHRIPTPKLGDYNRGDTFWPTINVSLRPGKNIALKAHDPTDNHFGHLDPKTSGALVPILLSLAFTSSVRISAKLLPRQRKREDYPGAASSATMPLDATLYAPKSTVQNIGKHLSKQGVWLRRPTSIDRGVEYLNPHEVKAAPPRFVNNAVSRPGYVMRTVEEIRTDVLNMFGSVGHWDKLEEMEQHENITTPLLAHQKQALSFMTKREQESDDSGEMSLFKSKRKANGRDFYYHVITGAEYPEKPPAARGGILADMMGLGKTLSILSLIVGSKDEAAVFARKVPARKQGQTLLLRNSRATLLICPLSVVANWEEQVATHIEKDTFTYHIYHGPHRIRDLKELANFDLVITSYGTVRTEYQDKKLKQKPIEQMNWFRIVLDEAHQIRDPRTTQSKSVCALSAQRRWAVTGTPVQNRLDDLGALLKFLRIEPFSETSQFQQHIIAPFKTGDTEILPKLRLLVDHITLRRLKDRIDLPKRTDNLVRLDFSKDEEEIYMYFAKVAQRRANAYMKEKAQHAVAGKDYIQVLRLVTILRLLSAHGKDLLNEEDKLLIEGVSGSTAIHIDDDEEDDSNRPALKYHEAYNMLQTLRLNDHDACDRCKKALRDENPAEDEEVKLDTVGYMLPCYGIICPDCYSDFRKEVEPTVSEDHRFRCPACNQYQRYVFFELKQSAIDMETASHEKSKGNSRRQLMLMQYTGPHTKTKELLKDLLQNKRQSEQSPNEPPIKSVVFSAWTNHLDLIEVALKDNGLKFTRLDGSMALSKRTAALAKFRDDESIPIILVSIYAGGLGLNLTTANKVYVMEPQFNPAAEAQAVDRVHRLGQKREVEVVRYIMNNSVEERVLNIQKKKRDLADLSMNRNLKLDKEQDRKRKLEELRDLFR